jgi:MazG family protein
MDDSRPTFDDVIKIMARLRAPGGCPWDRQQTHQTLSPYLLEEAYETLEAIEAGAAERLCEELGDLLLQVVFHAQMAAEAGAFTIQDVVAGLGEKLIRRHPHVFGDVRVAGPEAVLANWEVIKEAERAGARQAREGEPAEAQAEGGQEPADEGARSGGALDGLPRTLPALMLAQQIQARTARVGVAWPGPGEAIGKTREELAELERAAERGPADLLAEEMGGVLFTMAALARSLGVDGEQALRAACATFRRRFARLEEAARDQGRSLRDCTAEELLTLWHAAR